MSGKSPKRSLEIGAPVLLQAPLRLLSRIAACIDPISRNGEELTQTASWVKARSVTLSKNLIYVIDVQTTQW